MPFELYAHIEQESNCIQRKLTDDALHSCQRTIDTIHFDILIKDYLYQYNIL